MFGLPIHDKKGLNLISYEQGPKGIGTNSYLSKQTLKSKDRATNFLSRGHIIIIKYREVPSINILLFYVRKLRTIYQPWGDQGSH